DVRCGDGETECDLVADIGHLAGWLATAEPPGVRRLEIIDLEAGLFAAAAERRVHPAVGRHAGGGKHREGGERKGGENHFGENLAAGASEQGWLPLNVGKLQGAERLSEPAGCQKCWK